ncbi:MAG TPA: FAD-dependent oxidoreductase, partial [Candidatus Binataceae bacterium]|nr:FAD-dependent oxidoreductase [Candidatus Binataceae bacterium]
AGWPPLGEAVAENAMRLIKYGLLATTAGLIEAAGLLEIMFRNLTGNPEGVVQRLLEAVADAARVQLESLTSDDDEMRRLWEVVDLVLSGLLGILRFGLLSDRRGLDAIDEYDCREWLRMNGASERSLNSAMMRGIYDLAFAYENGDPGRPRLAAGQALRRTLRMFLTYRGSLFWKMRAGMGDVVFAPFYEVLARRGVSFRFFHRLENVKLAEAAALAPGEKPYVEALEFDVQAEIKDGKEYSPLINVRGLPCWPARPDYGQIAEGERVEREGWDFESYWDRRKAETKTLRVSEDFDFVVLGVGLGAIPHVCREIVARDVRWREMVARVKTVPTQAFQIWMREDMEQLGWKDPPVNIAGFVQPFDTWADMRHLVAEENWPVQPRSIAYFCSVLPDGGPAADRSDAAYRARRREEVRRNAIRFLNQDIGHLWPRAVERPGRFRWELLADPQELEADGEAGESRFDSQYWTANVNPTDRYVLSVPGSTKYRISPLDNSYDNLTIAGDWTDCGFNEGCVEAAVKSGRLAAHAISRLPLLEEIIGYDHP